MIPLGLARRYTKALFSAALEAGLLEQVGQDLALVESTRKSTPNLTILLAHPRIPALEKQQLLAKAFEGQVQELTLRFLLLVLRKQRQEVVPLLHTEYLQLVARWKNELTAEVRSAVPLNDRERQFVTEQIHKISGRKVSLREIVDAKLLGGLVIRYGDKQIDGSVKHHLEQLKTELKSARVSAA